jgi:hypothetical protein
VTIQSELCFDQPAARPVARSTAKPTPTKSRKLAGRMIACLKAEGCRITRLEFTEKYGFSADGRECRAGRKMAHGRILQGQKGYLHIDNATTDDVWETINNYTSQIRALQADASWVIRRAYMTGIFARQEKTTAEEQLGLFEEAS